jgi:hypothetical protein
LGVYPSQDDARDAGGCSEDPVVFGRFLGRLADAPEVLVGIDDHRFDFLLWVGDETQ